MAAWVGVRAHEAESLFRSLAIWRLVYCITQEKVLCCSVRCAGSTRAREDEDALELTYPLRYGTPRLSTREDELTWTISVSMQPCRRRAASACVALLVLRQRMAIRGSFCTHRPGLLAGCLIRDPGFQPRRMEWEPSSGGYYCEGFLGRREERLAETARVSGACNRRSKQLESEMSVAARR